MKKLLKLIEKYEEKSGRTCVEIRIFSDGSGTVTEWDFELFSFNNLEELNKWLVGCSI